LIFCSATKEPVSLGLFKTGFRWLNPIKIKAHFFDTKIKLGYYSLLYLTNQEAQARRNFYKGLIRKKDEKNSFNIQFDYCVGRFQLW
jgi:hypothetical protein